MGFAGDGDCDVFVLVDEFLVQVVFLYDACVDFNQRRDTS